VSASDERPIALDHLAFGLPEVEAAAGVLAGELGGRPLEGGLGPGFRWWQWSYADGARVEVITPHGPPGFLHRFLERQGAGVHHVTFKVPDIAAACARAREQGVEVVGYDDRNPGWKEAFLHPKRAQGIVVQLAQSEPSLDWSIDRAWRFPEVAAPRAPVAWRALVLCACDAASARRLWGDLLGGAPEPSRAQRLAFRWPGSPMRIEVEVDPVAPEGPRAVELGAERPLALPEGPHPVLGIPFRQVR
jgi:methylmalonyl-CoA/ethylmalonyl-CoA epimerase